MNDKRTELEIESELVGLIDEFVDRGENEIPEIDVRLEQLRQRYDKNARRGFLYYDAVEGLYDINHSEKTDFKECMNSGQWFREFKAMLTRKKPYKYIRLAQRYHAEYDDFIEFFDAYLASQDEEFDKEKLEEFRSRLNPGNPLELLMVSALESIETRGVSNSYMVGECTDDEMLYNQNHLISTVTKLLKGELAYKLFVLCDTDGETYGVITPIFSISDKL